MPNSNFITIKGAEENNLKNINLKIPKNKFVVITGVSGSGKSSLAFDTIYAEGYRRYMENFSPGARFFLNPIKKPKIRKIENLPPTIAVNQKTNMNNPRSTIGTITGIYDFLRFVFAGYGQPHCKKCGKRMIGNNLEETVNLFKNEPRGTRLMVVARWEKCSDTTKKIKAIKNLGYARIRIGGKTFSIREALYMSWATDQPVEVIIDRIILDGLHFDRERLTDSLHLALKISPKHSKIIVDNEKEIPFSLKFICSNGCESMERLIYKNFSFNSPEGACSSCNGLGETAIVEAEKIIPNKRLSLAEGAILPWHKSCGRQSRLSFYQGILESLSKKYGFSLEVPVEKISSEKLDKIIFGSGDDEIEVKTKQGVKKIRFKGVASMLKEKYHQADSNFAKSELEKFMTIKQCEVCKGKRLRKEFLNVKLFNVKVGKLVEMEIDDLLDFFKKVMNNRTKEIKLPLTTISEIISRLKPLSEIGLGYLSINRSCQSLSGGEFQRIRLANQLTSGLSGVLYILDEPSIGLHSRDSKKLIATLRKLKENGNSLIVVEHDKEIIKAADYIIDIGPEAGENGGQLIFEGTSKKLMKSQTQTARYLKMKGDLYKEYKKINRKRSAQSLIVEGVTHNNLKNVNLELPLGGILSIIGVSGSGKSSLINDVLVKILRKKIMRSSDNPGKYRKISGISNVSKIVDIDQSPLGRSSRSNPATYSGVFSHIRTLLAQTDSARKKGFSAGYFSFNMKGGRCEHCQGEGVRKIEMNFLEDAHSICPVCKGTKYSEKIRQIKYHGANVSDILNMEIEYARCFFSSHPQIENKLKTLCDVGLGYLKLGQSSTKLSGGEAQRVKLATELARNSKGNTLYVLDEPSIGLHFSDVDRLLKVLRGLADRGNTVLIIEHNLDMIRVCDWVIELGPGGGKNGGEIIFEGIPEKLAKMNTETGRVMK